MAIREGGNIPRSEFEELAMPHMDALYNTALKLTRNPMDAEDLIQDTYLRAYRFLDKFQRGTNFKAWIFKILTNTFINRYRKQSREPQRVDFDKVSFSIESEDTLKSEQFVKAYDELAYAEMFGDEISDALLNLSDEFRMIVLLADIEGFAYKEIADIVGCPIGTVMSRLSRGRRQLQRQLIEYAVEQGIIKSAQQEDGNQ